MNWKKITSYLAIAVVSAAVVFGIHALRIAQIEARLETVELVNGLLPAQVQYKGEDYLIPPSGVFDTGNTNEDIPSINEPQMISIASADSVLADEVDGIVVEKNGEARFYSLQILRWHEVVNDEINGDAIAVTHCTLCHSSNVFSANFDDEILNLSISGFVYNNMTLLQDDSTGALWLQGTGTSVIGNHLGEMLDVYEHRVMSWDEYKKVYPSGLALSTDTGFDYDYGINPYTNYDESNTLYFPLTSTPDRLTLKWMVDGFTDGNNAIAFSRQIMQGFGVEMFTFNDKEYVAFYNFDEPRTTIFAQEANALTFIYDFDNEEYRDEETGSLWTSDGLAIDGELTGTQLERVQTQELFWFCWYNLYPESIVAKLDVNEEIAE